MSTVIDVRLFGALELKSQYGRLVEKQGEKPHLFLLLKYLLLEPQREAAQEEVLRFVWSDKAVKSGAVRVRLVRLREMLEPLQPVGANSIVTFKAGRYGLDASYTLRFDTDVFNTTLKTIDSYPLDDPEGLKLCQKALELFRGPLLEYTEDTAWLSQYRGYYQRKFIRLGHETLKRIQSQNDTTALKLLCARAVMLAPEDEALQKELISCLAGKQMDEELTQHMRLLEKSGKATWLKKIEQISSCEQNEPATLAREENVVFVRLFGDVELRNEHGCMVENRARTPFLLLRYLLLKYPQDVAMDEILHLWPVCKAGVDPISTIAVRLRRAREALRPLHLDTSKGLIHYRNEVFWLNSAYTLKRDIDDFEDLLKKTTVYSTNDSEGLNLCVQALELCRGPLMEHTKSAPWLEEYRNHYQDKFCQLASDTLKRIRVLEADDVLPLLTQRAAVIAPECQNLHESIIRYLLERKAELELIHYLSLLSRSGKAKWMEKSLLTKEGVS